MRLIAFIEYAAVIMGVLAVIAGQFFGLRDGFHLGVFLIGAGFALGGLESLGTRRMCFCLSEDAAYAHAGAPAVVVGVMALLIGASIIAASYLLADGLWHSTVAYLTRRPAPVVAAVGMIIAGIGLLMMLNRSGGVILSLLGFLVLAAGVAGMGLGTWEWLQPSAFDRFVSKLPRELGWR